MYQERRLWYSADAEIWWSGWKMDAYNASNSFVENRKKQKISQLKVSKNSMVKLIILVNSTTDCLLFYHF